MPYTAKQRRWACAQTGKSRKKFKGKKMSKKEAEEMCTGPMKEEEINEYFDSILLEAKISDVREKFPFLSDEGWVDWGKAAISVRLGARYVSKYLMWLMDYIATDLDDLSNVEAKGDGAIALLKKFEKVKDKLPEKDVYKYNFEQLKDAIDSAGPTKSSRRAKAQEESDVLYNRNNILIIRPYTENASCYYGKGTKWCISMDFDSAFDEYTSQGTAFNFVFFRNIDTNHRLYKIAIVYDQKGAFKEAYNAEDSLISFESIGTAIALNLGLIANEHENNQLDRKSSTQINELLNDILDVGEKNALERQANPDLVDNTEQRRQAEEQIDEIQNQANFEFVKLDSYWEPPGQIITDAWISFEIPKSRFSVLPDIYDDDFGKQLAERIKSTTNLPVKYVMTQLHYKDTVLFQLQLENQNPSYDIPGLRSAVRRLRSHDENGWNIHEILLQILKNTGYFYDGPSVENDINEYFNNISKTRLDEEIEKITLEEWLDPLKPAPWDDDYKNKEKNQ